MEPRIRRGYGFEGCAATSALAAAARRGRAWLHAFPAAAIGLCRARAGAHARAGWNAVGGGRATAARGAAQRDAQGGRACRDRAAVIRALSRRAFYRKIKAINRGRSMSKSKIAIAVAALCLLTSHAASAQSGRTIKVLVPAAPGASTDFVARLS